MKRLLWLFPFYILILSGVPCSAADRCCQEEMQTTAFARRTTSDHGDTRDNKSDLPCSPFFPCGACNGIVIPNHTIQVAGLLPHVAKQPSRQTDKPLLAFAPAIWQPPKSYGRQP